MQTGDGNNENYQYGIIDHQLTQRQRTWMSLRLGGITCCWLYVRPQI